MLNRGSFAPFRLVTVLTGLLLGTSAVVQAENWPTWRGPAGNGISTETGVPTEWGPDKNVLWRTPLPGPAGATPVVWGDRIFLTSPAGKEQVLICLDTSGNEQWRRRLGEGNKNVRGDEGNTASPSPVTDGKHVWAYVSPGDLACFDFDGKEIWRLDLEKQYGKFRLPENLARRYPATLSVRLLGLGGAGRLFEAFKAFTLEKPADE